MRGDGIQFVRFFGPVIEALHQLGGSGRPVEVREIIGEKLKISEEEQNKTLKNGSSRFDNQVAWAKFYLSKAGYIESAQRGVWILTDKGLSTPTLSKKEADIIFKEIQTFIKSKDGNNNISSSLDISPLPEQNITIENENYRSELLKILQSLPPKGFENLCQELLRVSGFQRVTVTGRSGDGGIDGYGVLQINPFVSFKVLFQCKRYIGSVGSPQIRDFRGALQGRADKGIILTTGTFTTEAEQEALRDGVPPIELVDGSKLLDMFSQLEMGLHPRTTYDIDYDFFKRFLS